MKKKLILVLSLSLALLILGVGITYALLVSRSHQVVNTFVAGNINLSLTESSGSDYTLVPGTDIHKDPRVTVGAGSEECFLFFRLVSDEALAGVITYTIADGWTLVEGEENVWWRRVKTGNIDKIYSLLAGDCFSVEETATEEVLASLDGISLLSFTAYAVQAEGLATPEKAWSVANALEDKG